MSPSDRLNAELIALVHFLARVLKGRGLTIPELLGELQHNSEAVAALETYERMPKEKRDQH